MISIFWLFILTLTVPLATLLVVGLFYKMLNLPRVRAILSSLHLRLGGIGLSTPEPRYPVELWVWETSEDDEVCEECLDRSTWPPMDIADWMKEGVPGTPESHTGCEHRCRCRLVPYNSQKSHHHPYLP